MKQLFATVLLVLFSASDMANPLLVSDPTDNLQITHCAFYFDSATVSERRLAGFDNGLPYCVFDLADIAPGSHTVVAAFQIDNGVWGVEEGPLSDPFDFIRPVSVDIQEAPVLRIEISIGSTE